MHALAQRFKKNKDSAPKKEASVKKKSVQFKKNDSIESHHAANDPKKSSLQNSTDENSALLENEQGTSESVDQRQSSSNEDLSHDERNKNLPDADAEDQNQQSSSSPSPPEERKSIDEEPQLSPTSPVSAPPRDLTNRESTSKTPETHEVPPVSTNTELNVSDEHVLAVTVHNTDRLKTKLYISHPSVKVHIIDSSNGEYVRKSVRSRDVSYHSDGQTVDYIQPILTKKSEFRKERQAHPVWDQLLLFNESFPYLSKPERRVIFFFELVDNMSMKGVVANSETNTDPSRSNQEGWHRIAWAFLKLRTSSGTLNSGRKLRLQLFRAPKGQTVITGSSLGTQPDVFVWWKSIGRVKYPGSLYVTVKPIKPPKNLPAVNRSMYAIQDERTTSLDDEHDLENEDPGETEQKPAVIWTRVSEQMCKIPNVLKTSVAVGRNECFRLKFSNNGLYLACLTKSVHKPLCPVLIFDVPSFYHRQTLDGHSKLCHSCFWSQNDNQLLTTSADCTVRLWSLQTGFTTQLLPHTTMVYAAVLLPHDEKLCVTGAMDERLRMWQITEGIEAMLLRELPGHKGCVNAMCFSNDLNRLFSADNKGLINVWAIGQSAANAGTRVGVVLDEPTVNGDNNSQSAVKFVRDIKIDEIQATTIDSVHTVHDNNRLLVVQCRDGIIRVVDQRTSLIQSRFNALNNNNVNIRGCVSPCGRLVFSGTETGLVKAWTIDNEKAIATYDERNRVAGTSVTCVDYHPFEHMIAFCYFADAEPVSVFIHDISQPEITTRELSSKTRQPIDEDDYKDFNIQALLAKHNLLTKADSIDKLQQKSELKRKEKESKPKLKDLMNSLDVPKPRVPRQRLNSQTQLQNSNTSFLSAVEETPELLNSSDTSSSSKGSLKAQESMMEELEEIKEIEQDEAPDGSQELAESSSKDNEIKMAVAEYDYTASENNELSFKTGDRAQIEHSEGDWWTVMIDGRKGVVPANHFKLLEEQ